jgi:catechol 2,3-dioxygenase-like lactoylglutathione lyase family enzyme
MPPVSPEATAPPKDAPSVRTERRVEYNGINHIAMATNHMEKTVRFYRDLLGFRLAAAMGEPGFRHYFFEIDEHNAIGFFEWPDVEEPPRKPHGAPVVGPFGFDHLAFGVKSHDDLWLIKDRLDAAGFEVSDAVDHGICHSIYTFDPNGIAIEFAVKVKSHSLKVAVNDKSPLPVALEGADPQPGKWPAVKRSTPKSERIVHPGVGSDLKFDA